MTDKKEVKTLIVELSKDEFEKLSKYKTKHGLKWKSMLLNNIYKNV